MNFAMPQYEFRCHYKLEWELISELSLMQRLSDFYDRITPVIQKMLEGEQVLTPDGAYRLKGQGNMQFVK